MRTYHAERNVVIDHASGKTSEYRTVVGKKQLDDLIDACRRSKQIQEPV